MRLLAAVLGLALLTSPEVEGGKATEWIGARLNKISKPRRETDARTAEAMGHKDLAGWIRSGDLKSYKLGPTGVKVVGRSGATEIRTFTNREIRLSTDRIPPGSRVSLEGDQGGRYRAWTPEGRRIMINGSDVSTLRKYMQTALGER